MTEGDQAAEAIDARELNRTNLFLAATLYERGGTVPAKVRNLSPTGAMIEAATLPPVGATVRLARGGCAIAGVVVWANGKRCGVAFEGLVSVREWMRPPANREQVRVDRALDMLRHGTAPGAEIVCANGPSDFTGELALMARLLEQLGDVLSADHELLARHGVHLQKLDIVAQMLGATTSSMEDAPGSRGRLADLRANAEQALRSGDG